MKELWLFTTRFPHGFREAFLENELPVLCARFDRVRIFPEHPDGPLRSVPANVSVELPVKDPFAAASPLRMMLAFPLVFKLLLSVVRDVPSFAVLRAQWPTLRSRMAQFIHRTRVLHQRLMPQYDPERVTVYAYWTHDWVTVLGLVKQRVPGLRFFSRAHGFDVFEAQNLNGWIPFRSFQLQHVERIHCASRSSLEHLQQRWPRHAGLFELAQLGTTDHGPGPAPDGGPLQVVSCSFLIPRKRVLLLVEALALVQQPVHWTHFGGGEEEEEVRAAVERLPPHVKVDLRGMVPNADILHWYKTHAVDVFVHMSQLEGGVAVAVQEATSFGIPIIAADSGGVRELVGPRTGVLLGNAPSAAEVAGLLNGLRNGPLATSAFRVGVRQEWLERFEADRTYNAFVDRIRAAG
jgi:glycosyltransferase involved in cell wall biosynthesis